jgi:hypothetical protein
MKRITKPPTEINARQRGATGIASATGPKRDGGNAEMTSGYAAQPSRASIHPGSYGTRANRPTSGSGPLSLKSSLWASNAR